MIKRQNQQILVNSIKISHVYDVRNILRKVSIYMFDRKIILDKHKHGSIWGRGEGVRCKKSAYYMLIVNLLKIYLDIPPPHTHHGKHKHPSPPTLLGKIVYM